MNNNENYARYFITFAIFAFVIFFGYKYYEYKTIKDFITFQNKSEDQEYRFVEKADQSSEKIGLMFDTYFGLGETSTVKKVKKTDAEIFTDNYNLSKDIINFEKVITDADKSYNGLIKENEQSYNNFDKKFSILISSQGKLFKNFINHQKKYYRDEIDNSNKSIISDEFMQNYFQVLQDRLIIDSLEKAGKGKPKKFFADNFGRYSSLEKYTRSDYKFLNEETIKAQRPYGFELLDKNRKYIASYYELIKEYVFGDEESYFYKYEKFKTINSDFNIDMSKVFSEGESDAIEKSRRIMDNVYGKFLVSKKINNNLNKNSLFSKSGLISSDLSMCQSYPYRFSIFNNINDKYPASDTLDKLITELDSVNLSNKEADSLFDKSLLTFTNSKEKAIFECTDHDTKQKYIFSVSK